MGKLTITGVDMPQTTGVPDTFASKGFVAGTGDTNNSMLSIAEIFGASGWREYLLQLTQNLGSCKGAWKLDFRYSVVDGQGRSDVHTQRIDFQGPTDIYLTYLKSLVDSSYGTPVADFIEVGSTWNGTAPGDTDIELDFSSGEIDPLVFELKQASGKWILGFKGDASGRNCWHVRLIVRDKNTKACYRKHVIIYPRVPYAKICPATPALNVPAPTTGSGGVNNCPTGQIYDSYESKCKEGCSALEFYDSINHQCKKICSSDQILDTKKNECIPRNQCPSNEFWDSSTQACSRIFFSLKAQGTPSGTTLTYSVNFRNNSKISLSPPLTPTNLKTYTKIFLENYSEPEDFISDIKYSEIDQKIAIAITLMKEITKTTVLSVHFLSPSKLLIGPNSQPNHQTETSVKFPKVSVSELAVLESVGPLISTMGTSTGTAIAATGISVVVIGLLSGAIMFLIVFMNVVEFFSMYVFFNVRYSFLIDAVLCMIYNALDSPFIANPLNGYNSDDRDMARVYKYKLTTMEIPPWFFQNSNIEIFPIIFVYL